MTPFTRFVISVAMACLPLLAGAEGKCDDDPFQLPDGLAVTWHIAMVEAAVDDNPTGTLLSDLDGLFGGEPAGFPPEYSTLLTHYPFPAQTHQTLADSNGVATWLGGFNIYLGAAHRSALDGYFAEQRCAPRPGGGTSTCSITGLDCDPSANPCKKVVVYGWQVRHPPAENKGKGYKFCSCVLQRAALVFHGDKEELWVRTRFRSARPRSGNVAAAAAHFAPSTPVVFTFDSKRMWFPLAFNKLLSEPGKPAWLLLDVLTKSKLDTKKIKMIPAGVEGKKFKFSAAGQTVQYAGATWYVTRISRSYAPGGPASDLFIDVP